MPLPRLSPRGRGAAIAIGSMKDPITVQARTGTNSYGKPGGAYTDVFDSVAKIENIIGRENTTPAQLEGVSTHRITMPYDARVEPRMRILQINQSVSPAIIHRFDILWRQNVEERGFFLEILAQEIFDTQ
jgi:head-tail adaptor